MVTALEERLIAAFSEFEIIDCHEHLPPEKAYMAAADPNTEDSLDWPVAADACGLFGHYCRTDLITAGMAADAYMRMLDKHLPLDYRWSLLRPYLNEIRFGSYARAGFIVAKELYGFDDINDDTYVSLSEVMRANCTPGLFGRILGGKCKIRLALTQAGRLDYEDDPLLTPLAFSWEVTQPTTAEQVLALSRRVGMTPSNLDEYVDAMEANIVQWKQQGAVGLKSYAYPECGEPDRAAAKDMFDDLLSGRKREIALHSPLRDYLRDRLFKFSAKHELVMAIHAGMWGDFRDINATNIIPAIMRNPETRFDIYHLGMPNVRETAVMAKNQPNVWLNLAWTHIVSPAMTRSALDEVLDMVPVNKVFAFGGDYHSPVEKVYGHLAMAREDIAAVLARRIEAGNMTEDQAITIAHKWFWDNPVACYRLEV